MKLYKGICSDSSSEFFFLTVWRDKRFKSTIDLLLFYEEHFHGFSESAYTGQHGSVKTRILAYFMQC